MSNYDIGIDLGTTNVVIYSPDGEFLLSEPSVIAQSAVTGKVIAVGSEAFSMLGKTPGTIEAVMPMANGVISDYILTQEMISSFIKKIYGGKLIKPRVIICVPGGITEVETNAVVGAARSAGARQVYLIEEPVAAALGAGIDISEPDGKMILDIGGGTSDAAVLSFNGIVCKKSLKTAGKSLDRDIIKYVRDNYRLDIGEKMAEKAKIEGVWANPQDAEGTVLLKGRYLPEGLPRSIPVPCSELSSAVSENLESIIGLVKSVLEITPPELSADIYANGIILTGGSSQLKGFSEMLSKSTKLSVSLAPNPSDCVAIGTAKAFYMLDELADGFIKSAF